MSLDAEPTPRFASLWYGPLVRVLVDPTLRKGREGWGTLNAGIEGWATRHPYCGDEAWASGGLNQHGCLFVVN